MLTFVLHNKRQNMLIFFSVAMSLLYLYIDEFFFYFLIIFGDYEGLPCVS